MNFAGHIPNNILSDPSNYLTVKIAVSDENRPSPILAGKSSCNTVRPCSQHGHASYIVVLTRTYIHLYKARATFSSIALNVGNGVVSAAIRYSTLPSTRE